MTLGLTGKVALVTGSGSGIGRATALTFAREGAKVVVADIVPEGGQETVRMIKESGGEATFLKVDVSKVEEVQKMVKDVIDTYGSLDCVHNNVAARKGPQVPVHEYPEDEWDKILGIDLRSVFLCIKYEVVEMLKQGRGAIVNTASINGLAGGPNDSPYIAGKHGVVGLTKAAAIEYAREGIRVNAVCPGFIDTPRTARLKEVDPKAQDELLAQHPIGRAGKPEEIAATVVWLCSDAASFVTGHAIAVDGGYMAQ